MSIRLTILVIVLYLPMCKVIAQPDSAVQAFQQLPGKYFKDTKKKIDQYSHRISGKTEKTLTKLSRWESKVQGLLQKVNPEAAKQLFANEQLTFRGMLAQYKKGESVIQNYKAGYDEYRDKLTTQLKYLGSNKNLLSKSQQQQLQSAQQKTTDLNKEEQEQEALQKMIRERKKQLLDEAMKHLGKSKYLQKIDKETYYYVETLKNYKQLFHNKTKREETAKKMLNQIPGFTKFMRENSMLATLFGISENAQNSQDLSGLQTRSNINLQIQERLASGGPNARSQIAQNMQQAQAELNNLKSRISKAGGSDDGDLPDFRPNQQKAKTFIQRLEYLFDLQPQKGSNYMPGALNTGVSVGYKLNDNSTIGIGIAYKIGFGSIQKIKLTHQGFGLRTFLDWKLKKQFFISGGFEMNEAKFNGNALQNTNLQNKWQQSGLLGLTKKYSIGKNGKAKTQLLWDFLSYQQIPATQPIIFRIGLPLK